MDFGVTLVGFPVTLPFYVQNNGSTTVAIPPTDPNAEPYFAIVNVPSVPAADPRKEEYVPVTDLPFYVRPGRTERFEVQFRAVAGNPQLPPDKTNESILQLRVVDSANTLGPSTDKNFLLRALKTTKILASNRPYIPFDSVYVDPSRPAQESYSVTNVIDRTVTVDSQVIRYRTPVVGIPEIIVNVFPTVQFAPKSTITWPVTYDPSDMGRDSADFLLFYKPTTGAATDSLLATISGVGVLQQLSIESVRGSAGPITVRGDTIDFGAVRADGIGNTATIIVKNTGNITIQMVDETEQGTPRDTAAFRTDRTLRTGGAAIAQNEFDTLVVTFVPIDGGEHLLQYVVETDLLSRPFRHVPDGAQRIRFVLKGFAQRPVVRLSPDELDYGTVVRLTQCESRKDLTLTVRNVGNAEVRILNIRTEPSSIIIIPDRPTFTVAAGAQENVVLSFVPQSLGSITGEVVLETDGIPATLRVPMKADVVAPETIALRIGSDSARPGQVVVIPLTTDSTVVTSASRFTTKLTFEPDLLRYRSVTMTGTAAEGAVIDEQIESPPGQLTLTFHREGGFRDRSTLAFLVFDSFLGDVTTSAISSSNDLTSFGNEGCVSVLTSQVSNGTFTIDSLCGLDHKTIGVALSFRPHPIVDDVVLELGADVTDEAHLRMSDSYGRTVHSEVFVQRTMFSAADLAPGMYTIEVVVNGRRLLSPVMVRR
jgi:hypothetical protein